MISNAIAEVLADYARDGVFPEDINDGNCEGFAGEVARLCPEAVVMSEPDGHYFVCYQGRYYDAETPNGVAHWSEMPFMLRETRLRAWAKLRGAK